MPRTNRLDRFTFGFLQNPDFLFLAKPTLLHFVLPFFFDVLPGNWTVISLGN
jgi:hypothetical protein